MSTSKSKKFQYTTFDMEMLKNFELIKQGAEAKVYLGIFDRPDNPTEIVNVVVKERFEKTYRHPELDRVLTSKRIKTEVKLLIRVKQLDIDVPTVVKADLVNGVICMEHLQNSITCREFIIKIVKEKDEAVSSLIFNSLAEKIGRIIGKLHMNEVIHGDLTTSNMLVDETSIDESDYDKIKVYFIDFGLGSISSQLEEKAVDLYVLERALLSTHSVQAKSIFEYILKGYMIGNKRDAKKVIERFEAVRLRGRKRTMIG